MGGAPGAVLAEPSLKARHVGAGDFRWLRPQPFESSGHDGTEISYSHCALAKFLIIGSESRIKRWCFMPLTLEGLVRQQDKFKTFTKTSSLSRSQGTDMNQRQSLLHKEQAANKQ